MQGPIRDDSVHLNACLFVSLSPVKFAQSFATWQHLAASGGFSYRLRYRLVLRYFLSRPAVLERDLGVVSVRKWYYSGS